MSNYASEGLVNCLSPRYKYNSAFNVFLLTTK